MRVSQGFGGTREHWQNIQGNMGLFLGNRETKLYKFEDENIVSKFITRGTNTENVREHGNIEQFWKGTREQGPPPPGRPSYIVILATIFKVAGYFSAEYVSLEEHTKKLEINLRDLLCPFMFVHK